jgi:SAM-dependent methyltransferase
MSATNSVSVDPSNSEQRRAWDGNEGEYWAEHADWFDQTIAEHHRRLMSAAAIGRHERILDIGCGAGQTTLDAARAATSGSALGLDLSSQLIARAQQRAATEGVANATFVQADVQVHPFEPAAFDIAISRTGAMFFGDPVAAFTNVAGAVVPGGRLALVAWQELAANEWLAQISGALAAGRDRPAPPPGAPGPFALSDPDRVRTVLSAAGFAEVSLEASVADMWFGTDPDHAHRMVIGLMGWMLDGLDADDRAAARDALHRTLEAHRAPDGVRFGSAAWIIRATRR